MSQTYFQTALTLGLLGHKNAMVFVQFSSDLQIHSSYVRKDIMISKINLTNDICVFFSFWKLHVVTCYFMAGRGNFLTHIKLQLTSVIIHENLYCASDSRSGSYWNCQFSDYKLCKWKIREFHLFTHQKPPKLLNGKQEVPPLRKQIPKGRSKYPDDCDWDNLSL